MHDRETGTTTRVSVATGGTQTANGASIEPSISGDGRYVTFESTASDLVAGDNNGQRDVFVHDRQTGATTHVSVSIEGTFPAGNSAKPSISADGRAIAFESTASILVAGDTNGQIDVFVSQR